MINWAILSPLLIFNGFPAQIDEDNLYISPVIRIDGPGEFSTVSPSWRPVRNGVSPVLHIRRDGHPEPCGDERAIPGFIMTGSSTQARRSAPAASELP